MYEYFRINTNPTSLYSTVPGIIHGVEAVLVPSSVTSTLVDKAEGGDIFTTLVMVVSAAGLADALSGEGPFTVFGKLN